MITGFAYNTAPDWQIGKKNSIITVLKIKENALHFCKRQPAPCKAVSLQYRIVYMSALIIHRIGEKETEKERD